MIRAPLICQLFSAGINACGLAIDVDAGAVFAQILVVIEHDRVRLIRRTGVEQFTHPLGDIPRILERPKDGVVRADLRLPLVFLVVENPGFLRLLPGQDGGARRVTNGRLRKRIGERGALVDQLVDIGGMNRAGVAPQTAHPIVQVINRQEKEILLGCNSIHQINSGQRLYCVDKLSC